MDFALVVCTLGATFPSCMVVGGATDLEADLEVLTVSITTITTQFSACQVPRKH